MAYKRSRAAFEADLQAQQSPFVFYGTPLPPLDDEVRDDGSYVPVWKQTVTDERGRKRLHGAFTGGFSAGYFNTVGSKEGWTPSTFVSSRTNRNKDQKQRPEDFMDEEDLAEAAESRQLQTAQSFAGLGESGDSGKVHDNFFGLVLTEGETMGVKLLQRMGWRRGQGIGPKVRRQARLDEGYAVSGSEDAISEYLFAPDDTQIISFTRKDDHKGLGYQSEARPGLRSEDDDAGQSAVLGLTSLDQSVRKPKKQAQKAAPKKTGFGVGILNDNGSDEEDPYDIGPKIAYNKTLGGDKKPKKLSALKPNARGANPLLAARPIFMSRKGGTKDISALARTCHDGRLALEGFILSSHPITLSDQKIFPPPKVPPGWKPSKTPNPEASVPELPSVTDTAKSSTLDPKARASLLGEARLPGKSVFDYLSKDARDRIAEVSGKDNLPQGRGEAPPEKHRMAANAQQKDLWSLVPHLDKEIASSALSKGSGGWMPYAEDLGKRSRYIGFLQLRAGSSNTLPERVTGMSVADWVKELEEFVHAAQVFKPVTGLIASRFTSSTSHVEGGSQTDPTNNILRAPKAKPDDPAEQAAKLGMYGPMTRSILPFYPTRLLCKRFHVRPPADVPYDESESSTSANTPRAQEAVSKAAMDEMVREAQNKGPAMKYPAFMVSRELKRDMETVTQAKVDVETNEALEKERPGEEVFRAIFGSDDED